MAELRVETPDAGVRVFVLTRREKRNALSLTLIATLCEQLRRAEAEGVRSIVIAGEGAVFSAGADFADLDGSAKDEAFDAEMSQLTSTLSESPMVSFAAISGPCVGAGLDLALSCDFRVAGSDAVFSLPAVKMGILYNPSRLAKILPMLGRAMSARLLLLSERLDRTEATMAGVVTHHAGDGDGQGALELAIGLAGQAARLPNGAQRTAKAFIRAFYGTEFNLEAWQAPRMELLASAERDEALRIAKEQKK